jgi:uncharacterized protein HemX
MPKNQKIAAGCGGLGCLGLIVAAIAGGLGYYFYVQRGPDRTYNVNVNSNSNNNSTTNRNANESTGNSSSNSSSGTASTYSDDEKHRLFQAASMTRDAEVVQRVVKKVGLFKADGTPADDYPQFIKDHFTWGLNNADFVSSLDTPEKARAYVDAHL